MFFTASKLFWAVAMPVNFLCLLGLFGLLVACRRAWRKTGQGIMKTALAGLLILGLLPAGPLAVHWLEGYYRHVPEPPERVDGIIMLGGLFESYTIDGTLAISANDQVDRLFCFMELGYRHPEARMVFSGGAGNIMKPSDNESDSVMSALRLANFPPERLEFENRSRNTYENVLYSKEQLKPQPSETWVVITSAYHMPRAMGIFEQAGWPVHPYQCDPKTDSDFKPFANLPNVTGNFYMSNLAAKELIGAIVYYVTGKSAFILPPPFVGSPHAPVPHDSSYRPSGV